MNAKLNVLRSVGKVGTNQERARQSMPKSEWSLSNSIWWLIVSKAADRSRPTMTVNGLLNDFHICWKDC